MSDEEKDLSAQTDKKVYEVGYLLIPKLAEEEAPAIYGNIKELVARLGGEIISDEMPRLIPLAYSMSKVIANVRNSFNTAYFGWVKFYMDAEKIAELKKNLNQEASMLRFLITKTVKENTMSSKRFTSREGMPRRRIAPTAVKKEEGEAVPINKEEIDKEIEALVATE